MKSIAILLFAIIVSTVLSQKIPYSYASGRDVGAVENRYNNFHAAKAGNASSEVLNEICGKPEEHGAKCPIAGRPSDDATTFCDSMCCLAGHKVGNCGKVKLNIKPDWLKVLTSLSSLDYNGVFKGLNVDVVKGCSCSDDWRDVKCGPDGSFLGIRCPDRSACWRKCCRKGQSGGKCFLGVKCRCK